MKTALDIEEFCYKQIEKEAEIEYKFTQGRRSAFKNVLAFIEEGRKKNHEEWRELMDSVKEKF